LVVVDPPVDGVFGLDRGLDDRHPLPLADRPQRLLIGTRSS
jgi:hypothetical protein